MLEQYAIVPFVAQAEVTRPQKAFEPGERSQRYAISFLRFLEPLLRE